MKDKLELLLHIDRPTRLEVMQWCRDYETEIKHLQRQCELLGAKKQLKEDDVIINITTNDISRAVVRAGKCTVFLNVFGKFKVLTQDVRIVKESRGSTFVGVYDRNFDRVVLVEDLLLSLEGTRIN